MIPTEFHKRVRAVAVDYHEKMGRVERNMTTDMKAVGADPCCLPAAFETMITLSEQLVEGVADVFVDCIKHPHGPLKDPFGGNT